MTRLRSDHPNPKANLSGPKTTGAKISRRAGSLVGVSEFTRTYVPPPPPPTKCRGTVCSEVVGANLN